MDDAPFIPACAYRRLVPPEPEGEPYVACGCSGGVPLGMASGDRGNFAVVCTSCTIPAELDRSRRPCLYLVPVRIWEGDGLRTGFSCRWFAFLKPKSLPPEVWMACFGCPYWFPRPTEEESVPGMNRWVRKVIRMYWEPVPEPDRSEAPPGVVSRPVELSDRFLARIQRIRVALAGR